MNYYQPSRSRVVTQVLMDLMGLPRDAAALRERGYFPIAYPYPEYDKWTQEMRPLGDPVPAPDGQSYVQNFEVLPLSAEALAMSLERYKAEALARLNEAWLAAEQEGKLESSAGFVIDANERANRDITGLITMLEASGETEATFCAADNTMHPVNLEQLKNMQIEVIHYGQQLYARKWAMRAAIEGAASFEDVDAVRISFGD